MALGKFAGLKVGTGENEKILIDEFGAPTKEGLLAAGIGVLSAFGALVLVKDILSFKISRAVRKTRKQLKKAENAKFRVKNQALKQQAKAQSSELKELLNQNRALLKEQEKLKAELQSRAVQDTGSDAGDRIRKLKDLFR
ncbi:MAG: hypothetical protein Q4B03_01845 [Lachnospiraceae bacterium]|nr:hypothetical protein [Lachnospiraceae bacterium]